MSTKFQTQMRRSFSPGRPAQEESSQGPVLHREPSPRRNRPQSVMAQDFSISLDHIFNINDDIISLTNDVDRKRQSVSLQTFELRALEAQLREVDERLRNAGVKTKPHRQSIYSNASPFSLGKLDEFIFPVAADDKPHTARPRSKQNISNMSEGSTASSTASDRLPGLDMENSSGQEDEDETELSVGRARGSVGAEGDAAGPDDGEDEEGDDEYEVVQKPRKRSVVLSMRANEARKARELAAAAARQRH